MSTFKFVGANTASHSGGITVGFLYDNLLGTTTSIPPGTTELDFTGNATGTSYAIGIVGGDGNDILTGLDGNDVFTGGKGNDTITGGNGNDQLFGGLGANTIDGGAGSDIASADFADQTSDVVAVNGGVDGITYNFTVGGSAFGSVVNVEMMIGLVGGTGNDRLGGVYSLDSRDSTITGGLGTDTAVVDLSADPSGGLSGGFNVGFIYNNITGRSITLTGFEVLEYTGNATGTSYTTGIVGGDGNDILTGLAGNDVFTGGKGNDTITGGKGDDALHGGTGANTIEGGEGYDIASADFSDQTGAVVALNLGVADTKYDFTVGGAKFGSVRNIEMMSGLTGGTGGDRLGGVYNLTKQTSTISGGAGTDTAVVDLSVDTTNSFSGGIGANNFIYNNTIGYFLNLNDIEVLEFTGNATGSSYNVGIVGGDGNDILTGLAGNDVFTGGKGNDTIAGGKGDDALHGGTGANTIEGGEGYDIASADFSDQTGAVVALNLGVADTKYDFTVGGAKFGSVRNVEMMSGLTGGTGGDRLGGVYNLTKQTSTISGGAGTDTAVVDLSADTTNSFSGGIGANNFIYNNTIGYFLNLNDIEVLEFTGNATGSSYNVGIVGAAGNDILTGLAGNDVFNGAAGNDKISGAAGNDSLAGGTGANTIDGGADYDVASADFSDQTGDVVALAFGVGGIKYDFTVGGKAYGSVVNVEMMTGLTGGKGNDRLGGAYILTGQHSTISGGDGTDTAVVDLSADAAGKFSGGLAAGIIYNNVSGYSISLAGMEVLEFTGNAVSGSYAAGIVGGAGNDILTGLAGNDIFSGAGGNDIIAGAAGNDILSGGTGANTIDGGANYDIADADFSDQTGDVVAVNGGVAGVVYQFTVAGKAYGSVTNIEMMSGLTGGTGNDRLGSTYLLTSQNTSIAGGAGTDTAVVDLSADINSNFSGGIGAGIIYNNTIGYSLSLSAMEALEFTGNAVSGSYANGIVGGGAADILTGLSKADIFRGGDGNDRLRGNGGDDQLFGDAGDDTAVFSGTYASHSFKFNKTNVEITGADGVDSLTDIEILEFADGSVELSGGALLGSTVSIDPATVTKAEGSTGGTTPFVFTLNRTGGIKLTQTVDFVVAGVAGSGTLPTTAADFPGSVFPTGTATFAAGATTTTITVNVAGDAAVELNERFSVTLVNPYVGVTIGTASAQGVVINDDSSFAIAALSANKPEGTGGTTPFTFTVTRSGALPAGQSVNWAVAGAVGAGTQPANAADFGGILPSGTLVFAAGQTSQTITIDIAADAFGEADDRFAVTLSSPSAGAILGTASAQGVIANDDISLAITADGNVSEGQAGTTNVTFTVLRSGIATGATTANWTVAGVGGAPANAADFSGGVLPSGVVSFTAGETSKTITVAVAGDNVVEANEDFTVTLTAPTGGAVLQNASASATIDNDDASFAIGALSASKVEGTGTTTPFTFTVTRTGDTTVAHSVDWAVAGITGSGTLPATAADFAGGVFPAGTLTFAIGEVSKTLTVDVLAESLGEFNERFAVTLSNSSAGSVIGTASAQGVVFNDDTSLAITPTAISKTEGNAGTTAYSFTVGRAGTATGSSSVNWTVGGSGGAPANAVDFVGGVLPGGSVTFLAGETSKIITVDVAGDTLVEGDEAFTVTLAGATGAAIATATATGTIVSDDAAISIAALSASKPEGTGGTTPFTFTLTRIGATAVEHSVKWAAAGLVGSGTLPSDAADFLGGVLPSGTTTFAIGETSKIITVNVAADLLGEFNERFAVTLSNPSAGAVLGTATAGAVIFNDDTSLAIAPASINKNEGNAGTTAYSYTVARSGSTTGTTSVDWAFTPGGVAGTLAVGAADFVGSVLPSGGTLTFTPGQTSKTIILNVAGDTAVEFNESFTLTLSNATAGVNLTASKATGVLLDDDTIYGTTGNDNLVGTNDADLFVIGAGQDSITGGLGTDVFRFLPSALGAAAANAFTFEDLSRVAGEKLDLSRIDAIAGGTDNAFSFINTAAFSNIAGQLRWEDTGVSRRIEGDVNGDSVADLTIFVKAAGPVDANWFIL